jgi:hypothetical protein
MNNATAIFTELLDMGSTMIHWNGKAVKAHVGSQSADTIKLNFRFLTIDAEIHEAVMLPPNERRDRAKVDEAVREGLRLGPLRPGRECGPLRRSEGDGVSS